MISAGTGSFEIPVLCLLVHGEPRILKVSFLLLRLHFPWDLRDVATTRAFFSPELMFRPANAHMLTEQ